MKSKDFMSKIRAGKDFQEKFLIACFLLISTLSDIASEPFRQFRRENGRLVAFQFHRMDIIAVKARLIIKASMIRIAGEGVINAIHP